MPTLKQIVEEQDTAQGKFFDISIQLLIIFSAITFAIETLPDLDLQVRELLNVTEVIVVAIFTVEYLLRLYFSERKLSFIFSFYGLVDLIAILPFYLAIGLDLRSLRTFRLVRVARLLKLARYSKAMQRFHTAFKIVKEEVVLFGE